MESHTRVVQAGAVLPPFPDTWESAAYATTVVVTTSPVSTENMPLPSQPMGADATTASKGGNDLDREFMEIRAQMQAFLPQLNEREIIATVVLGGMAAGITCAMIVDNGPLAPLAVWVVISVIGAGAVLGIEHWCGTDQKGGSYTD